MSGARYPHVLIIGGGLGGLALARALQKRGIAFTVFERDVAEGARLQGWALSLHDWLIADFQAISPHNGSALDLRSLSPTAELGIPSGGAIFNVVNGEVLKRFEDESGHEYVRANRRRLRDWLLLGLDVQWGKKFIKYEQDSHGVTAIFDDGSTARGDMLVGADGISSAVRRQLLGPDAKPKHVAIGVIVGELTASKEQYERWMSRHAVSFYVGSDPSSRGRRIFVGVRSVAKDLQTAEYYWSFGWHDEKASEEGFWTSNATKEQLHQYVMENLDGMSEDLVEPLRATNVEGMLMPPLTIRDMVPPRLPTGRVTLLGDAVHPMSPCKSQLDANRLGSSADFEAVRGEGGNNAMKDSFDMASFLGEEIPTTPIEDVLKLYEAQMTVRATKSVLASRPA